MNEFVIFSFCFIVIENQTHKYLSVAKQLEIEFTKIVYSERKTEEVALREVKSSNNQYIYMEFNH